MSWGIGDVVLEPGPVNLAEMDKQRKGCKKKRNETKRAADILFLW